MLVAPISWFLELSWYLTMGSELTYNNQPTKERHCLDRGLYFASPFWYWNQARPFPLDSITLYQRPQHNHQIYWHILELSDLVLKFCKSLIESLHFCRGKNSGQQGWYVLFGHQLIQSWETHLLWKTWKKLVFNEDS